MAIGDVCVAAPDSRSYSTRDICSLAKFTSGGIWVIITSGRSNLEHRSSVRLSTRHDVFDSGTILLRKSFCDAGNPYNNNNATLIYLTILICKQNPEAVNNRVQ